MSKRPSKELSDLYRRFVGRCYHCRRKTELTCTVHPLQATRDHLVPKSKKGGEGPDNVVLSCYRCNNGRGTVPVDLSGVFLASGVSGKGLGAFPGLSMVFYHHEVRPAPKQLPRYLDLGFYAAQQGIPFTHSSNLLSALQAALRRLNVNESYKTLVELSAQLRVRLADLGYQIVAPSSHASPAVFTLALPAEINSKTVGWQLQKAGYLLSYRSDYLISRNWIQICLMGEFSRQHLDSLLAILAKFRPRRSRLPAGASLEPVGI